jgi:hypothetical protein
MCSTRCCILVLVPMDVYSGFNPANQKLESYSIKRQEKNDLN